MNQRCPATNGCRNMDRFGHLFEIRPLFQARRGVGLHTIGTLYHRSHSQRDQRLFPSCQRSVLEHRPVVVEKLLRKIGLTLCDLDEPGEVFSLVIGFLSPR